MKFLKNIFFILLAAIIGVNVASAQSDADKVKQTLSNYNGAIEKLDLKGTEVLFAANSQIIESGSVEGTYKEYQAHHLTPELDEFKSFKFSDYKADVTIDLPYAFITESYKYTIVVKKNNSVAERRGVATSILKKDNGVWKIVQSHNSSRKF